MEEKVEGGGSGERMKGCRRKGKEGGKNDGSFPWQVPPYKIARGGGGKEAMKGGGQ
jgi:hypothetical protein